MNKLLTIVIPTYNRGPLLSKLISALWSGLSGQLNLAAAEKSMLTAQVFIRELRAATVGFKAVMSNERLCIHYRMERRHVPRREMLATGLTFTVRYFKTMFGDDLAALLPFVGSLVKAALAGVGRRPGAQPDLRH